MTKLQADLIKEFRKLHDSGYIDSSKNTNIYKKRLELLQKNKHKNPFKKNSKLQY